MVSQLNEQYHCFNPNSQTHLRLLMIISIQLTQFQSSNIYNFDYIQQQGTKNQSILTATRQKKMGNSLKHPIKDVKFSQLYTKSGVLAISASMQGWRQYMEDFYTIQQLDEHVLFTGVFDGHGGPEVACYASRKLYQQLKKDPFYALKNYYRGIVNSFKQLDEMIISEQGEQQLKVIQKQFNSEVSKNKLSIAEQVGSTANILLLTNQKIYLANVGDSRAVLCRNGVAIPLSSDHKPQNQLQKDRIKKAGGHVNRNRINSSLNVSRTFGDFYFKKNKKKLYSEQMVISIPEIKQMDRDHREDQYILMATDGVWEKYGNNAQLLIDQINAFFVKAENWQEAIKEFLHSLVPDQPVQNTTGYDNMTIVLAIDGFVQQGQYSNFLTESKCNKLAGC